jgi:16S rRNA (guanine(1405)-N(7))-methyltransferase
MDEQLVRLVEEVTRSTKYAHTAPELVARIGASELAKGRKFKQAIKAVKNKLHQVGGAYQNKPPDYSNWLEDLRTFADDPEAFRQACRRVMGFHASTSERLPILSQFYKNIFDSLPLVNSVLDVACGLNPLALPWMPLEAEVRYFACDMYTDMVEFLRGALALLPVVGQAAVCDVIGSPPDQPVDLALVLKTIPCLEQIDKDAGARLLDGLQARFLVVSFPTRSLGGRKKGMEENFQNRFEELISGRDWQVLARRVFETELAFVVQCY